MEKRLLAVFIILLGIISFSSADRWGGESPEITYQNIGLTCERNFDNAMWVNYEADGSKTMRGKIMENKVSVPEGNCSEFESEAGMTCCPIDYMCNSASGKCEYSTGSEKFCDQFLTETECKANEKKGRNYFMEMYGNNYQNMCERSSPLEMVNGELCSNQTECLCGWDSGRKRCEAIRNEYKLCEGLDSPILSGSCKYYPNQTENLCKTQGVEKVRYELIAEPSTYAPNCPPGDVMTRRCEGVSVIPFFNIWNFIGAMMLVIGIYFVGRTSFAKLIKFKKI